MDQKSQTPKTNTPAKVTSGQQNAPETPQTSTPGGSTGQGKKIIRIRITGPVNTVKKKNIRDRLGPPLKNLVFTSNPGTTQWNRQIEGQVPEKEPEEEPEEGMEPEDPKDMSQQELIDEVIRLRSTREDKDPESTDDSEEEQ